MYMSMYIVYRSVSDMYNMYKNVHVVSTKNYIIEWLIVAVIIRTTTVLV